MKRREFIGLVSGAAPAEARSVMLTLRPEGMMAYQETFVQRDQHRIYVRDHPGAELPVNTTEALCARIIDAFSGLIGTPKPKTKGLPGLRGELVPYFICNQRVKFGQ